MLQTPLVQGVQLLAAVTVLMLGSSFFPFSDDVLHCELIWVTVCLDHVVPLPEGAFVEDDVARHVSSPSRRIIESVRLAPGFVAYEDNF